LAAFLVAVLAVFWSAAPPALADGPAAQAADDPAADDTASEEPASRARPGDVIFQALNTLQTQALIQATGSEWTHCGLVFERNGRLVVMEALIVMAETPLEDWIARGGGRYVLTRWTGAGDGLSPESLAAIDRAFGEFKGRYYDFKFQWSDDRIYCSELVQKIFERAVGVELAPLRRVGDYDLDGPAVRNLVRLRFADGLDPEEPAVAPVDLLDSPLLARVE
jgi:hypothetical protein